MLVQFAPSTSPEGSLKHAKSRLNFEVDADQGHVCRSEVSQVDRRFPGHDGTVYPCESRPRHYHQATQNYKTHQLGGPDLIRWTAPIGISGRFHRFRHGTGLRWERLQSVSDLAQVPPVQQLPAAFRKVFAPQRRVDFPSRPINQIRVLEILMQLHIVGVQQAGTADLG